MRVHSVVVVDGGRGRRRRHRLWLLLLVVQRPADEVACAWRPREEGNTRRFRGKVTSRSGKEIQSTNTTLQSKKQLLLELVQLERRAGEGRMEGQGCAARTRRVGGSGSSGGGHGGSPVSCSLLLRRGQPRWRTPGVDALLRGSPFVLLDYSTREKYAASVWTFDSFLQAVNKAFD